MNRTAMLPARTWRVGHKHRAGQYWLREVDGSPRRRYCGRRRIAGTLHGLVRHIDNTWIFRLATSWCWIFAGMSVAAWAFSGS